MTWKLGYGPSLGLEKRHGKLGHGPGPDLGKGLKI